MYLLQVDKFHKDQQSLTLNNGTSAAPVVAEVQPVSQWDHNDYTPQACTTSRWRDGGSPKWMCSIYFNNCQYISAGHSLRLFVCEFADFWVIVDHDRSSMNVMADEKVQFSTFFLYWSMVFTRYPLFLDRGLQEDTLGFRCTAMCHSYGQLEIPVRTFSSMDVTHLSWLYEKF